MIFPYPEVHEMERDKWIRYMAWCFCIHKLLSRLLGDIYRCPYCEQAYVFKDGKLRTQQSGASNAQHTYSSSDMRIGVEVKGVE